MFLARRCQWCCVSLRGMASVPKNHYDSLGVKASATHAEIKTAYYEMSKIHHPDANKGSDESLAKFRQIADAYEVLGNVNSRKLYDRGLVVGGSGTILRRDDVEADDPTTRFYRQREKRSQVPTPMDRTTVYDFDAWARAHYVHSMTKRSSARKRYDAKLANHLELRRRKKIDVLFIFIFMFLTSVAGVSTLTSDNNDVVRYNSSQKSKETT